MKKIKLVLVLLAILGLTSCGAVRLTMEPDYPFSRFLYPYYYYPHYNYYNYYHPYYYHRR